MFIIEGRKDSYKCHIPYEPLGVICPNSDDGDQDSSRNQSQQTVEVIDAFEMNVSRLHQLARFSRPAAVGHIHS